MCAGLSIEFSLFHFVFHRMVLFMIINIRIALMGGIRQSRCSGIYLHHCEVVTVAELFGVARVLLSLPMSPGF